MVLLTRPAAQSLRFAESLRARMGLTIVTSPLLAPEFLVPPLPGVRFEAVILTSETGAEAAGRIKRHLPDLAFCVGDRTAEVAHNAGFTARNAHGDAEDLLALILSHPAQPLLHLRGREVRGDLAQRLCKLGLPTEEVVVYAQNPHPLTLEAAALLTGTEPLVIPLFSPRSAQMFADEYLRVSGAAPLFIVAISDATAKAASGLAATPPQVSPAPDGESMLEAVLARCVAGQGA